MRENRTKKLLREGKTAVGISQSQIRIPELAKMLARAELDWVFIDSEHGPFTTETLHDLVQATLQTPITPVVRVPDFQYDLVARALDSGAEGVIFPRTESVEILEKAVSWTKFPPQGVRGYGLGPPQLGYEATPFDQVIRHMNAETLVIAQVETMPGLEICDEMAAVEGLDSLLVGPADIMCGKDELVSSIYGLDMQATCRLMWPK